MAAKNKRFEDEVKDLETIINQIDSGELTLEESITAFERGVALVKSLNQRLDEVQSKVEMLTRDAEGQLQSSPLDLEIRDRQPSNRDEDDEPF